MIFSAGLGTRLKPLTDTTPKALIPLAGKTLLQWQIEKLKAAGITNIVVNVHHFAEQVIDYLREHDNFGCNIQVSDERDMLLETGGGLRKAQSLLTGIRFPESGCPEDPILICNVDILSNIDIPTLLKAYNPDEMGVVVVSPRETQRYLLFDEDNRLCGGWMRAYDMENGEYYGINKDLGWGPYCIMGGWIMGFFPLLLLADNGAPSIYGIQE